MENKLIAISKINEAFLNGNIEAIDSLITEYPITYFQERGRDGKTILHHLGRGAGANPIEGIRKLLNAGVPVDLKDFKGNTCLMYACDVGNENIIKLLIENKTNMNEVNKKGRSALMFAAERLWIPIIELLIMNNADLNIKSHNNETAESIILGINNTTEQMRKLSALNALNTIQKMTVEPLPEENAPPLITRTRTRL